MPNDSTRQPTGPANIPRPPLRLMLFYHSRHPHPLAQLPAVSKRGKEKARVKVGGPLNRQNSAPRPRGATPTGNNRPMVSGGGRCFEPTESEPPLSSTGFNAASSGTGTTPDTPSKGQCPRAPAPLGSTPTKVPDAGATPPAQKLHPPSLSCPAQGVFLDPERAP